MNKLLKTKLNTKSYYNFLESSLSIDDIIQYAKKNNLDHACLLDKNMHGVIEFYNKCLDNNLKPIIGLEIENFLNQKIYVIAKNYEGYKILCKLSSYIELQKPYEEITLNKDSVFVITEDEDDAFSYCDYYVINQHNKRSIAFMSAYFKTKNDASNLVVLNAISSEKRVSEFEIINPLDNHNYLENVNYDFSDGSLKNLEHLINCVNLIIPNNENHFIEFNTNNENKDDYLFSILNNKLKELNKDKDKDESYLNRLNFEFNLLKEKGFIDYFLVVADFVNFARKNEIEIGPGRGSAPGSLISYLLDITKLDPIENNLLFERFLNEARFTMPDIDIDVMDLKRDKLINSIVNKYGEYNVSHIITFSRYKLKMALRDIGRILDLPISLIDKICKKVTLDSEKSINELIINNPELNEVYLENKMLFDLAEKLIGLPRQYSIHAAGIILSNKPIFEIAPIIKNSDNKIIVQYSMEYLEQLGLIKIDLLGLRNLTTIKQIVDLIEHTRKQKIDLNKIPLTDSNVYKMLAEGKTNGIFQFESPGMRNLLMQIKPKKLEDLSITSAIFRPGASSHIKTFIKNKNENKISYLHKDLEEILKPTYGAIIYQEQIINIVQKFAKFNATESDLFRKAISKKDENKIIELKGKFISSCIKNGYNEFISQKIFNFMFDFASYGFNHSHSLSYALISYQLAYLKYHFPLETMTILLNNIDKAKLNSLKEEAYEYNVNFMPPDINLSSNNSVLFKNDIYLSFNAVHGISNETTKKILNIRNELETKKFDDPIKAISILNTNGVSKKNIESLIKVGTFDSLNKNRNFLLSNIDEILKKNSNIFIDGKQLFDVNLNDNIIENKQDYVNWEIELLGFSISISDYQKTFNSLRKEYYLSVSLNLKQKDNYLIEVIDCTLKQNNNNEPMLLINGFVDNKKITIYDFDNNQKLIDNGLYIVTLKPFKNSKLDNFILEKVIKKIEV